MASSTKQQSLPNFANKMDGISERTIEIWCQEAMKYDLSDPERAKLLRYVISASRNYSKQINWHVVEDEGSKQDRKRYQTARDDYQAKYGKLPRATQEPAKAKPFAGKAVATSAGGKAVATSASSAAIDFGEIPAECNPVREQKYSVVRLKGQPKPKPA
jgi:hypothetical protein